MYKYKKYLIALIIVSVILITVSILFYLQYRKSKKTLTAKAVNKLPSEKVSDTKLTAEIAGEPIYLGSWTSEKQNCPDGYTCVELADGGYICKQK